jgi:hypothetical protein
LKLECDELLSNSAFKFNLRHYSLVRAGVVSEQFLGELDAHLAKLVLGGGASAMAAMECGAHLVGCAC